MYKIITQFQQIIEFAKKFAAANKTNDFVPAYADTVTGKKPACKGFINYEKENAIGAERLIKFSSMTCLGVRLGTDYVVFDLDGASAVERFKALEQQLGTLPSTFHNGSLPGDREALWFKIPARWQDKFTYVNLAPKGEDKLEVRSGKCHQVACGEHPVNSAYKQISKTIIVAELPENWCLHVAGKMAQAELESGAIVAPTNGNGKKQYNNEVNLSQAVSMLDFLLSVGHPLGSDFTYENRFRIGCALHSIDDSDEGLQAWFDWVCKAADCEYKTIEELRDPHWKSIKQDKNRGVTFGTIKGAFNSAYVAAKKDPELSGIVEQYKALYSHTTAAKQEIIEFFDSVHYLTNNDQNFSLNDALLEYSFSNRIRLPELQANWDTWLRSRSYDRVQQDKALEYELQDFKIDVTKIFNVLPGGKEVKKTLEENNFELLIGLLVWIGVISSLVPKNRLYQFAKSPVGAALFMTIVAESGIGKSPLIDIFTTALVKLDNAQRQIDADNKEGFKRYEWIYKDTPRKDRANLVIPAKFGGKPKLKNEAKEYDQVTIPETTEIKIPVNELYDLDSVQVSEDEPNLDSGEMVFKPEPAAKERFYIYQTGTPEAFRNINANQKEYRILWIVDELARITNLMQSYNGGNDLGNDAMLISVINEDRINNELVNDSIHGKWGASLISGIQPETLDKMAMLNDSTGKTGRFIFIDGSTIDIDHVYAGDSTEEHCHAVLEELYKKMDSLPNGVAKPSREVFQVWKDWDRQCRNLANLPGVNFGYRYWLRKVGKNILKIAGVLQDWIYCDMEPGTYDPFVITDDVVLMSIELGDYLVEYHRRLFKCTIGKGAEEFADDIDDELLGHQTYIMRYLTNRGKPAKLNDLVRMRYFADKKMNSVAVRAILETMTSKVKFAAKTGYSLI